MATTERTRRRAATETPRIVRVRPSGPNAGRMLAVLFENGEWRTFDVGRFVARGGVFEPLREHDLFAQVVVLPNGWGVEWTSGADLSRDTLYHDGMHIGMVTSAE